VQFGSTIARVTDPPAAAKPSMGTDRAH